MITNCPKCGTEFENKTKWGTRKFCSRSCSNSRERPDSVRQKISNSVKTYVAKNGTAYDRLTPEQFDTILEKSRETREQNFLSRPFEEISPTSIRRRIVLEQKGYCNKCGLNEWQGEPIALELEHKDGDNQNNSRDNLECLCPNCHATTDTWRGRNKNRGRKTQQRVTNDQMVKAYLESPNIRQALINLGLSAKGANYSRMKRCLTLYGIDH